MQLKQLRTPRPNKISFRTIYYSNKHPNSPHQSQMGESMLENALIILLEHDPDVVEYLNQAVPKNNVGAFKPLTYYRIDGIREEWTPDFAVIWKTGRLMIIEVKPLGTIRKHRDQLINKWTQTAKLAKENNWDFLIFTDGYKSTSFRVENLMDLESQLFFSTKECQTAIIEVVAGKGEHFNCLRSELGKKIKKIQWNTRIIQQQLSKLGFSSSEILASVFNLIYQNYLNVDLDDEFLLDTPIAIDQSLYIPLKTWLKNKSFRNDDSTIEVFDIINESSLNVTQTIRLKKHQQIIHDYKNGIKVSVIGDKHEISNATVYRVLRRSGYGTDLKGLLRKSGSGRPRYIMFEIDEERNVSFLDPQFHEAVLYYETPEEPDYEDTWKKYVNLKRTLGFVKGLIDTFRTAVSDLTKVFKVFPTKSQFMAELHRYCDEFSERVYGKRRGYKEASKKYRNVTGATPGTNYIGQVCQIDHTPSDVIGIIPLSIYYEIKKKESGNKSRIPFMKKAIITTLMDLHTRVIIGYAFRYKNPSVETNFLTLRRAILGNINPFSSIEGKAKTSTAGKILRVFQKMADNGDIKHEFDPEDDTIGLRMVADWWDNIKVMPRILHTDNGSDFQSKDLLEWGEACNMKFHFRPVGGANYGGHIERLLKTLNTHAFHSVPGTTKGTIQKRGDYKSEKKAILEFEQLEALFLLAILHYHVNIHSSLGTTPMEAWNAAVKQGHNLVSPKSDGEIQQLAFNMMKKERRTYVANQGIQLNTLYYNHTAITISDKSWAVLFKPQQKISVRVDSTDIRFVWWWNPILDRPVRIWASKIILDRRVYGRNELQRISPLSKLTFWDIRKKQAEKIHLKKKLMYERLGAGINSVEFSLKDPLPKTAKEKEKKLTQQARLLEKERIAEKERQDLATILHGSETLQDNDTLKIEKPDEIETDEEDSDDFQVSFPDENPSEYFFKEIQDPFNATDHEESLPSLQFHPQKIKNNNEETEE